MSCEQWSLVRLTVVRHARRCRIRRLPPSFPISLVDGSFVFCKFCSVDFRLSFRHNILSTSIVSIYHLARVQPIQTEKIRKAKSKKETRLKILNKQERKERKSTHIGNTIQASTYHQLKTNSQKYLNNWSIFQRALNVCWLPIPLRMQRIFILQNEKDH